MADGDKARVQYGLRNIATDGESSDSSTFFPSVAGSDSDSLTSQQDATDTASTDDGDPLNDEDDTSDEEHGTNGGTGSSDLEGSGSPPGAAGKQDQEATTPSDCGDRPSVPCARATSLDVYDAPPTGHFYYHDDRFLDQPVCKARCGRDTLSQQISSIPVDPSNWRILSAARLPECAVSLHAAMPRRPF